MVLNSRRFSSVGVRTVSGTPIGRLASVDLDGDTGKLVAIRVAPRGSVAGLLAEELVIGWHSVVSMREDEAVVEDGFVPYVASQFSATQHGHLRA